MWGNSQQEQQPDGGKECIRVFITIKGEQESHKLSVMAPLQLKISMFKRMIEREYSDLFPHEPTFICAKLEDEFGYSLSNSSFVYELLKPNDRLFAIPELFTKDLIGKMHLTHDLNELTFMQKSITQTIVAKLAEADLGSPQTQLEILQLVVPVGFTLQQKAINHNVAMTIKKIVENERLQFLEDQSFQLVTQLLVKLLQFWTNDLIFQDQFLLNLTVDVVEILLKSAIFAQQYKTPQIINNFMSVSKLEFVSAQTRSRIIKIISYLSRTSFSNLYNPKSYEAPLEAPQSRQRRAIKNEIEERKEYVPSMIEQRRPNSNRREQPPRTLQSPQYAQPSQSVPQNQYSYQQPQYNQYPQNNSNQYQNTQQYPQQNRLPSQQQYTQSQQVQGMRRDEFSQSRMSELPPKYSSKQNYDPQQQVFDGLVQDYLNLVSMESNEEMLQFAIQNLSDGIDTTIHQIMDNKEAFAKIVNVLEIAMSPNYFGMQMKILEYIAKNMNEARAKEGVKMNLVKRIMKAFTYQPKEFHNILYDFLSATLKLSDFTVDVATVISMIESPYQRISQLGIKILALMSDPSRLTNNNVAIQFENYIKSLMEWTLDTQRGEDFSYNSLQTLANLSLNDQLRPQILYLKGIEFFLKVLRDSYRVDAQRVASKALLNLSIKSSINQSINFQLGDTKLTIVSELEDEMKKMNRGEMDTIVQGYLQTLIATRDRALV